MTTRFLVNQHTFKWREKIIIIPVHRRVGINGAWVSNSLYIKIKSVNKRQ